MLNFKFSLRLAAAALMVTAVPVFAQGPRQSPQELDRLVGKIALYPDPLLAQVLTASTFWNQLPEAAAWANDHRSLTGDALSRAIQEDRLPWDPSVLALLPFPSVLTTMNSDRRWTESLGNAVLSERNEVMDAVQRMRQRATGYGYLRPGPQYRIVNAPGDIEILPVDPTYIPVPVYDPYVVYAAPRPGFFVGGAINFGPRVFIGGGFAAFGWGGARLGWREHAIFIDNHPWRRDFGNREVYVHPYDRPFRRPEGPRIEHHEFRRDERHDRR